MAWEGFWLVGPPIGIDLGVADAVRHSYLHWGLIALIVSSWQVILGLYLRVRKAEETRFSLALDPERSRYVVSHTAYDHGQALYVFEFTMSVRPENGDDAPRLITGTSGMLRKRQWLGLRTTNIGNSFFQTFKAESIQETFYPNRVITTPGNSIGERVDFSYVTELPVGMSRLPLGAFVSVRFEVLGQKSIYIVRDVFPKDVGKESIFS